MWYDGVMSTNKPDSRSGFVKYGTPVPTRTDAPTRTEPVARPEPVTPAPDGEGRSASRIPTGD